MNYQGRGMVNAVEQELDLWVERLAKENMPIFNRTVQCVAGTTTRENSSLSELAWTILEDPPLTVQVIKLANSMYYNPYSTRISTVSRAVMRLGFNIIKEICFSIALVETVLSGLHKDKLSREVARAFHAAFQARRIAVLRNLPGPEEIFIAALLTRIGRIAFWCSAGQVGAELEGAVSECESEEQAEMKVLGFKLERLTQRLNREWKLSDLLESALRDNRGTDPRIRSIKLGCAVAQASEEGWDSPQIKKLIKEAGDFLNYSEKEMTEILHESARAAAEVAVSYGAEVYSSQVPLPASKETPPPSSPVETVEISAGDVSETAKRRLPGATPAEALSSWSELSIEIRNEYPNPDPSVQLYSLRDLSILVTSNKADPNMVLSIVLEGIYRGIGMDRVLFALLTPDRKQFRGKYALGWIDDGRIQNIKISANSDVINVFGYLLKNRNPIWVTEKPDNNIKPLLTEELCDLTGGGPFFAMPITIKGTVIGVIYSDRNQSRRKLDEESFESFAFFGRQTNMSLAALSGV
jgi:HD-like signal output (HDOD) protein